MDNLQVSNVKAGAAIILQDFHTLEALGDKYSGVVADVQRFSSTVRGASLTKIVVNPQEGLELIIVSFTNFQEMPSPTFRMYRRYLEGPVTRLDDPRIRDTSGRAFVTDFHQRFEDLDAKEDPIPYLICPGFPVKSANETFCAWEADPKRVDQNYWARFCLAEVTDSGFGVVWFGWDISSDDVKLLV